MTEDQILNFAFAVSANAMKDASPERQLLIIKRLEHTLMATKKDHYEFPKGPAKPFDARGYQPVHYPNGVRT